MALKFVFAILENFRESVPFILPGNIASSLQFELISRKIGLVFFFAHDRKYQQSWQVTGIQV